MRLLIIFLLLPFLSVSQIPDAKPNTYVNDYTNSLSAQEILQLNKRIKAIEDQSTVQIAIVLINQLPDDMPIEDYARTIGNKWKVGKNFNGIVYVAALQQRKQRLEIARNLEGQIPDVVAAKIIDNLKTNLRQQDYNGAIDLLVSQIAHHLGLTVANNNEQNNTAESSVMQEVAPIDKLDFDQQKAFYDKLGNYIIGLIILGVTGFLVWAKKYRKKYIQMYTVNGVYYGVGSSYYNSVSDADEAANGNSSGFGGFGGGGGGGFSGGGASGSW